MSDAITCDVCLEEYEPCNGHKCDGGLAILQARLEAAEATAGRLRAEREEALTEAELLAVHDAFEQDNAHALAKAARKASYTLQKLRALQELHTRVMLRVEWSGTGVKGVCQACRAVDRGEGRHEPKCQLDFGLIMVGLKTQEQRNARRAALNLLEQAACEHPASSDTLPASCTHCGAELDHRGRSAR